jgi:hypothetical protein
VPRSGRSPTRTCLDCGTPCKGSRCPRHKAVVDRAQQVRQDARRPSSTARGYGSHHQRLRARWAPLVDDGLVACWRCTTLIAPGSDWHLGHDMRRQHVGPEHARCNLVAAAAATSGGIVVVAGPPCAGKSTYVREHALTGDLVLDRDVLGGIGYDALLASLIAHPRPAWVIASLPGADRRAQFAREVHADRVVLLVPDMSVLMARAARRPDPVRERAAVRAWHRRERW